jgi:hypothetical protein
MRVLCFLTVAFILPVLGLAPIGCAYPAPRPPRVEAEAPPSGPPSYAVIARERALSLQAELSAVLKHALPAVESVRARLEGELAALPAPERLITSDRLLRTYHDAEFEQHKADVIAIFERGRNQLAAIMDVATAEALRLARRMAPERSPLDAGATGDILLDKQLTSFAETLRALVLPQQIEARQKREAEGRTELVPLFSTFGLSDADGVDVDDALGGRLLLFVGGPESAAGPHGLLAFKFHTGVSPENHSVFQVMRHRIMRGHGLVQDMGWRVVPTTPELAVHGGGALLATGIMPSIDMDAPTFDSLRDMRIVVDVQTTLLADGKILGGLDWRVEFRVTARGAVSWEMGTAAPAYDALCDEARELLVP